jgi:hypothetical protein
MKCFHHLERCEKKVVSMEKGVSLPLPKIFENHKLQNKKSMVERFLIAHQSRIPHIE